MILFKFSFIFTLEILILCKKVYGGWGSQGLEEMNFDIPWNFVKEYVFHNFTKYFSESRVNQIVNKDLNGELTCLSSEVYKTY